MVIATSFVMVLRQPLESALAASITMMNKPSAMQRPPVMQSLLESIEHETGMCRS